MRAVFRASQGSRSRLLQRALLSGQRESCPVNAELPRRSDEALAAIWLARLALWIVSVLSRWRIRGVHLLPSAPASRDMHFRRPDRKCLFNFDHARHFFVRRHGAVSRLHDAKRDNSHTSGAITEPARRDWRLPDRTWLEERQVNHRRARWH